MRWTAFVSMVVATVFAGSGVSGLAVAAPAMFAKAKQQGYPARNCQYCHVAAMPKKETFKPDDLNDRGQWLVAEKDRQKAKAIDVDWLKNYPGGKEQK
jgi:hypothetical protein